MVFFKIAFSFCLVLLLVRDNNGHGIWSSHEFEHNHITSFGATEETCEKNCRQSPIDIKKEELTAVFREPLIFNDDYCKIPKRIDMHSDGHSIVLKFLGVEPIISSGPLNDNYVLQSIHFHWGQEDTSGSEHQVNGCSYPLEMHAVHTKNGIDLATAQKDPTGIVVIGYLFEIKPYEYSKAMRIIAANIHNITEDNLKTTISRKFALSELMTPFHDGYVSYNGSLTTPPYSEAVIWLLSPYTIKITSHELEELRKLSHDHVVDEEENFREPQPLYGRAVNYNFLRNGPKTVTGCSSVNSYWFENIFASLLISQ